MATSIQAGGVLSAGVAASRVGCRSALLGSFPARQFNANPANSLHSPFLGCGSAAFSSRNFGPDVRVATGSSGIRCASFLEKLAKLFSSSPEDEEQTFGVYEINEGDRRSPVYLRLTTHKDVTVPVIGDLVPYTNKVYDYTGKKYLGISAGLCTVVEHNHRTGGDRYETTMSHYLDGYGHISCQGPYYTDVDSEMVVTGGTGVFAGAKGCVLCHNIKGPLKILYTYKVKGIPTLPSELTREPLPLEEEVVVKASVPVQASA